MNTSNSSEVNDTPHISEKSHPILQNFLCVWLDEKLQEANEDFQRSIYYLRGIVPSISIFQDVEDCIDYISEFSKEKVFIIVSERLGQQLTEEIKIDTWPQIDSIYVFCNNQSINQSWVKNKTKIKGVLSDIEQICKALDIDRQRCEQSLMPISFRGIEPTFMYSQLLRDTFLKFDNEDTDSIKELADFCRHHTYATEADITRFEKEYHDYRPIWWYTACHFLYSMVNRSLRILDVDILLKMRFFIRDLHQDIQHMHNEQKSSNQGSATPFHVYRGQSLTIQDFEKLKRSVGQDISFNSFLSTSVDRTFPLEFFARDAPRHDPNLVGILFAITIDPTIAHQTKTYFANLTGLGHFDGEKEILFTTNTVFKIHSIERIPDVHTDRLWEVNLTNTDQRDEEWDNLSKHTTKEVISTENPWEQLAHILLKLGYPSNALQIYRTILGPAYNIIQSQNATYDLETIHPQTVTDNEPFPTSEQALDKQKKSFPLNHPDLATSYNIIGNAYSDMGEYSKALSYYERALDIQAKSLPSNHPDLATSYNNIATVYSHMGEYSKALSSHERALDIRKKSLPSNHPHLATSYENIGTVYSHMGEYSKALSSHERALDIQKKSLPSNHPDLASAYNNIGLVYSDMSEYSKALSSYERALDIQTKSLPSNHPHLVMSYGNIGTVYSDMGEYSKALSSYERALDIRKKSLPSNHPDLASSYNNIGNVYSHMGEYSKALSYYERALDIEMKCLPLSQERVEFLLRSIVEMKAVINFLGNQ